MPRTSRATFVIARRLCLGLVAAILTATSLSAQTLARETTAQRDARMRWWRDAQFGLFIHWGAYAVPAGMYHGDRVAGTGEWIMSRAKIPIPEYEQFVRAFNPVRYDADAWVTAARDAGMKYIILTSKHHDGFALFDSHVSSYDVVHASPYHRDVVKALADAAHRQGMRFGVYYSIMDWHHPDAQGPNTPEYNSRTYSNPEFDRYVESYMKPQLKELLTQYPNIDVLWFDGEWIHDWTDEKGQALETYLRAIKPGLIINNRVGHSRPGMNGMTAAGGIGVGDFGTPEQRVPPTGFPGIDWETCMTMNDTWGFTSYDDGWKDTRTLLRTLIDVAAKGGNFLLNVGPTASGEIPPESRSRLREMGRWMRANGESIYATTTSPYGQPAWGRYTARGDTVYAHVFDWPKDGRLMLAGVGRRPRAAYLLADRKPLAVEDGVGGHVIRLPAIAPSSIASVVVLDMGPAQASPR